MIDKLRILIWLAAISLPGLAHAQIFVCKDANGRTITADRPIAECAARPMRELGNNGVTKREIAAPLTADQKRQRQIDAERAHADAEAALEQRRRDMAILERFRNEGEINAAHTRAIEDIQQNIKHEIAMLALAEKQLREAEAEAEALKRKEKNGKLLPHTRQYEEAKSAVSVENEIIRQQKLNMMRIDTWFDETLKRYRLLSSATPAQ